LTVRDFLNRLNENGLRVEKAYLFGSHARGNAREGSDIDIAVISKSFSGNRFDDMMALFEVRRKCDLRIEPIPFHPDDFNEWDPPRRRNSLLWDSNLAAEAQWQKERQNAETAAVSVNKIRPHQHAGMAF
jgi:predicted nucleotidyltransferase